MASMSSIGFVLFPQFEQLLYWDRLSNYCALHLFWLTDQLDTCLLYCLSISLSNHMPGLYIPVFATLSFLTGFHQFYYIHWKKPKTISEEEKKTCAVWSVWRPLFWELTHLNWLWRYSEIVLLMCNLPCERSCHWKTLHILICLTFPPASLTPWL